MNDESLLQFPCDFPIKVMGVGDPDFRRLVVELVRRHAPDLDETRVQRPGQPRRTLSVGDGGGATPATAPNWTRIYQELSGHPRIKLVL